MNVSKRWLRDMVPGLDATAEELAEHLAARGAPVESIGSPAEELGDIVVGRVIEAGPHPNADRLSLCLVDGGDGEVQVVCGAPNVKAGAWYPFAPVGAVLPGDFKIKKAKIRGEVSQGMLCSAKELGLGSDHAGILEIEGDFTPGESFVAALGLDDATLDVEVTANRGDLLSHIGIARELASEGNGEVVLPPIPGDPGVELSYVEGAPEVGAAGVSIRIDDAALCGRYLGAVVRGVTIGPSPAWLQERLRGAGARPINNVVDATNYVMLELGQPLHAFDLKRLAGPGIVVRRPAEGESSFTTLDDEKRALTPDMLMICDTERPVAIAGVMGGVDSEVEDDTTDLLIECALFDPKSIRATRRALNMSTDASYRFERGVDPEGMRRAIERCVAVILATAGGTVDGAVLACDPVAFEPAVVPLRLARIEQLLGVPFTAARVTELLTPLGFEVADDEGETLHVRVPGFRSYDVTREVDLIEEVARTHGFDAFPDDLGAFRPGRVPDHPLFRLEDELRDLLVGQGLFEAQTPAFAPAGEGDVEVSNPLATTEPVLRSSLVPSLIRRVEYNLARGHRDVRLFELGTAFRRCGSARPPHEETRLAVVLTGRTAPPHWSRPDESFQIWDVKALGEALVRAVFAGAGRVEPAADVPEGLDPEYALVLLDGDGAVVGRAGRVRDDAVDAPVWADDVWALELTLPAEVPSRPAVTYQPLPAFPAVERDLAVVVGDGVTAGAVTAAASDAAGGELESIELFDVYTGEGIPEGTRSLALRLRFRSAKKTLKDKDVDKAMKRVRRQLEEELGVEFRG